MCANPVKILIALKTDLESNGNGISILPASILSLLYNYALLLLSSIMHMLIWF